MTFLTVYADDCLLFSNHKKLKTPLKKFLCERFRMKDLCDTKYCLGLRIRRDTVKGELYLDQEYCYAVATQFELGLRLRKSKTKQDEDYLNDAPCKEAIGSLMYLSQSTERWSNESSDIYEAPLAIVCATGGVKIEK